MTFDAEARRFDTTMHRARARVAALDRTIDELMALRHREHESADGTDPAATDTAARRHVVDNLLDELKR